MNRAVPPAANPLLLREGRSRTRRGEVRVSVPSFALPPALSQRESEIHRPRAQVMPRLLAGQKPPVQRLILPVLFVQCECRRGLTHFVAQVKGVGWVEIFWRFV